MRTGQAQLEFSDYAHGVLEWLAGVKASTVAVIAVLLHRRAATPRVRESSDYCLVVM